ncbi:MAG: hypothetical protein GX458_14185 [Phyllobacteriaceae bacterium]|nr:hypothetical protein [Phyllobacteriaceae bacterium]
MERVLTKASGKIGAAAEAAGRRRLALQAIAGAVAFGLGLWGWILKAPPHDANGLLNDLFRTVQLITLHFPTEFDGTLPWQLQIGRLAVPIVAFAASFHVVLGAITRPVRLAMLPLVSDHVLFFGTPRLGDAATNRLVTRGHRLVFVHPALESERVDVLEGLGVTVVTADPFLPSVLDDLGVASARAVFVATCNDVDDANLAILVVEAMARRRKGGPAPIVAVEFERDDLADELVATVDASARHHAVRFHRLSPDREGLSIEVTAHAAALAGKGEGQVHALVVGLVGGWRQALSRLIVALQARPDAAPIVTLLLGDAEAALFAEWRAARPDLALIADVRVLPCAGGLIGMAATRAEWRAATPPPSIVVVMREDAEGLATALALRRDRDDLRAEGAIVLVRQGREDRILSRLSGDGAAVADPPIAFGGLLREETIERLLDPASERRAIALHAHYLSRHAIEGWTPSRAVAAWEALPENLRDANRAAADHVPILLAAIGRKAATWTGTDAATLSEAEWAVLARIEHRRWAADRIDRGWRFGPVRDDDARRHPCLVPWEGLSDAEKAKDLESVRTLLTLPIDAVNRPVDGGATSLSASLAGQGGRKAPRSGERNGEFG